MKLAKPRSLQSKALRTKRVETDGVGSPGAGQRKTAAMDMFR